jgi:squalene synthase HpnC
MTAAASIDPNLAYRYCLRLAREHPENFFIGSFFLPRSERRHLAAVYAYARIADDLADGDLPVREKLAALQHWEEALGDCLRGVASHPVFVALGATIRERTLPIDPLRDLLRAFRYDAEFRPFATFEDLLAYCRCSANPVGRIVLALLGYRDEDRAVLAGHICTALQLTNFWQDLSRDLARGRLYLPLEDLERFGVDRRALLEGRSPSALESLLRFEVQRTRELFDRGLGLADRVSAPVAREVRLFAKGGLTILRRIETDGYRPIERRPELSTRDKLRLLAAELVGA